MTHFTANMEDLDATLPMIRDVETTDDESTTFVTSNSVVYRQSAQPTSPATIGPGPKTPRFHSSMQHGGLVGPRDGLAGQATGHTTGTRPSSTDRLDGLPSSVRLADLDQSSRELPAVPWDNGVDWESDDRGEVEPGVPRPNRNPLVSSLSTQPTTISPVQSSSQPTDRYNNQTETEVMERVTYTFLLFSTVYSDLKLFSVALLHYAYKL